MEPNLLVGDRLFVSKYTYGYSKHSFPFSPNIFEGRFFFNAPKQALPVKKLIFLSFDAPPKSTTIKSFVIFLQ